MERDGRGGRCENYRPECMGPAGGKKNSPKVQCMEARPNAWAWIREKEGGMNGWLGNVWSGHRKKGGGNV